MASDRFMQAVLDRVRLHFGRIAQAKLVHQVLPMLAYRYQVHRLIENFFNKLKQYRTIATRYDKTTCNFLGAIYLAAAVVWFN